MDILETSGKHSLMAERVAITRAAHQCLDQEPLVFADPLAMPIIGPEARRWLSENLATFNTEGMRRSRGMVTIRSRFAEEQVLSAVARGTTQYVILGAGLDTFAYRQTALTERLVVFEVDQPDTQRWKLDRLADAGIPVPPNLRFVPLDFNEGALGETLAAAGFRRDAGTVFSWLGVVYYLPPASIFETLRFIAGQSAESQVIFDFAVAEAAVPRQYRHLFQQFGAYNRTASERWQTWFTPEGISRALRELGFTEILHLDAELARTRYLRNRTDGLLTGPLVGLISAAHRGPTGHDN